MAWLEIKRLFRDQVSSQTLQLKVQFHNLKKGDLSINDYVHRLKSIADALISIDNPISETDLVLHILSGFPPDYMHVSTSISTRISLPSFVETRSLLFLHESQLNNFSLSNTTLVAKQHSFSHGRGRNQNGGRHSTAGRGRGRHNLGSHKNFSTSSSQYSPRPQSSSILGPPPSTLLPYFSISMPVHSFVQCQLCLQPNHCAYERPSLNSKAYISDLQYSASNHSFVSPGATQWMFDTGD